jgi:hypothetical protein
MVTATAPEAGTTKEYHTSAEPGKPQAGFPPLAALLWYVAPAVEPGVKTQVPELTVNGVALHGESPCAFKLLQNT